MSIDSRTHDIGMTIPVVGSNINERRARFLKSVSHDRFEIAVHGFTHKDFSGISEEQLKEDVRRAKKAFEAYGFSPTGYRAPYLRSGRGLLRILSELGFTYSSSVTKVSDHSMSENKILLERCDEIALEVYGTHPTTAETITDRIENGIIEIPVSLPDDEILIDRVGINDDAMLTSILEDIVHESFKLNSYAVIQIHPERYPIFRNALLSMREEMKRDSGVHFISLTELSKHLRSQIPQSDDIGKRKFISITGDLDIMSLRDLLR